jgi:GNAT superfamily N-acetyltransferase
MAGFALRLATPADAGEMAENLIDGFESYRDFAPPGWEPPTLEHELRIISEQLGHPDVWGLLAAADGEPAGHVSLMPASRSRDPVDDPHLAHFWHLFVRRSHWGTGLARDLHAAAVAEAARRSYTTLRLATPAGQARARRFYEREGWTVSRPEIDTGLGIPLVEYRRPVRR